MAATFKMDNRLNVQQDRLLKAVDTAQGQIAVNLRRTIERNIRARTNRITGKLRAGCRAIKTRQGWVVYVGVRTNLREGKYIGTGYWRFTEYGTRYIRPRRYTRDAIREVVSKNPGRIFRRVFVTGV